METLTKKIREEIYNDLVNNHSANLNDKSSNIKLLVLMFDYYNSLCVRKRNNHIMEEDIIFLNSLKSNSIEEVLTIFKSNDYYILQALSENYNFGEYTTMQKQNYMHFIHYNPEKNILTNNLLYMIDVLGYQANGKLEEVVKNYCEFARRGYQDRDRLINEILFNLEIIKEETPKDYKTMMLEIIHEFYKLDKYRLAHSKEKALNNRFYHLLIRILSDNAIMGFCEISPKFVNTVVELYFYSKNIIPEDFYKKIVDETENKLSKRLVKKLNNTKKED